jgi:hypothetical protein
MEILEKHRRQELAIQEQIDQAKRDKRPDDVQNLTDEQERTHGANQRELRAFDESQRREMRKKTIDQMRQDREQDVQAEAALRVAQLRAAGKDYEADRAAFEAAWDAKIRKIRETGDAEAATQAEAQRDAERAARERERQDTRQSASVRARTAELRASHQDWRAKLEETEERNRKLIDDAKKSGDPAQISAAYREARANVKQLQEDMKEQPQWQQGSMRELWSQLQGGILADQGGKAEARRRDREGATIGAQNADDALKTAQEKAAKDQQDAAKKIGDAADKIGAAPIVIIQ